MKAAVSGSSGFIGSILLNLLRDDNDFSEVQVLSRRKIELSDKFNVMVGDISTQNLASIDVAFCALGTTIATAGSKEAFYQVEHNLVIDFAKNAKTAGAAGNLEDHQFFTSQGPILWIIGGQDRNGRLATK